MRPNYPNWILFALKKKVLFFTILQRWDITVTVLDYLYMCAYVIYLFLGLVKILLNTCVYC